MAGSALPPFDIVSLRHSLEAFNPPIKGIILHLFENFVCFAHEKYDTKYDSTTQVLFMLYLPKRPALQIIASSEGALELRQPDVLPALVETATTKLGGDGDTDRHA